MNSIVVIILGILITIVCVLVLGTLIIGQSARSCVRCGHKFSKDLMMLHHKSGQWMCIPCTEIADKHWDEQ